MSKINFVNDVHSIERPHALIVHLSAIRSKEDLLKGFAVDLKFPEYFGLNWDALADCLRDLHWIIEKEVVLVHDELPSLDDQMLRTYLQILHEAVDSWKPDDDHSLRIVFPKGSESRVHDLLT